MANRCYLVGWDAAKGAPMKPSLELNYDVALFWYGLFGVEDIHDATVDGDAFVKPPGAGDDFKIQTYLYSTADRAIERLGQRLPLLIAASGRDALATKFQKFIGGFAGRGLLLQVSELAWMVEPGEYVKHLRAQLALVENLETKPAQLVSNPELLDEQYGENLLVGWGTELTRAEKVVTKERRAVSRAANAETKRAEQFRATIAAAGAAKPYRASSTFEVGDVIEHVKLGTGIVLRLIEKKKIEVEFADGNHTLIHQHQPA